MKRWFAMLCMLMLLCSTACAAFDYTPYQFEAPCPSLGVKLLRDGSAAEHAWEHLDGSGENYLTWWSSGTVIRKLPIPREIGEHMNGFDLLERADGALVLVGNCVNEATRGSAVTLFSVSLCTVDDRGFGPVVEVTDAALNIERCGDDCFALFELRDGQAWLNLYEAAPEWSWSIPMDAKEPQDLYLSRVCRDGDRWLVVYNPTGYRDEKGYRLLCVERGAVLWEHALPGSGAILGDSEGGFYLALPTGSGSYKPLVLYHYGADGRELARKTISTNKLVLGVRLWLDPATGLLQLYGTAVANSRKVYTAWHAACDADLKQLTELDARNCSYYGDYSPRLYIDADGLCQLYLSAIGSDNVPPVLVPFEALPSIKNPGVSIK